MVVCKLFYQSPRPFWTYFKVQVFEHQCEFSYATPSTQMFNLYFFYGYNIYMYFV